MNFFRLGHIGLPDDLPLLFAQTQGFFAEEKVNVEITQELGWASVCGKLAEGRLDGACMPATLPALLALGLGLARVDMRVLAITSYEGLALCQAARFKLPGNESGARAAGLRIGVVAHDPAARFLAQAWLQKNYPKETPEVSWVNISSSQLIDFMQEGAVDVFCGPAIMAELARLRLGARVIAQSGSFAPAHPGSVVALRLEQLTHASSVAGKIACCLERAKTFCRGAAAKEELRKHFPELLSSPDSAEGAGAAELNPLDGSCVFPDVGRTRGHTLLQVPEEEFLHSALRLALGPYQRSVNLREQIRAAFSVAL